MEPGIIPILMLDVRMTMCGLPVCVVGGEEGGEGEEVYRMEQK